MVTRRVHSSAAAVTGKRGFLANALHDLRRNLERSLDARSRRQCPAGRVRQVVVEVWGMVDLVAAAGFSSCGSGQDGRRAGPPASCCRADVRARS